MEARMETAELEKSRYLIPTIAVVAIITIALAIFSIVNRDKSPESGEGGKVAAAGGAAAAGAANADEKDGEENGKKEKAPVPVNVVAISTGAISSYISATANLVAEDEVKVIGESEGRVTRLLVDEGDYVKKGQTLAVLNRDDAEILRAKAKVRAENAGEQRLERRQRHGDAEASQETAPGPRAAARRGVPSVRRRVVWASHGSLPVPVAGCCPSGTSRRTFACASERALTR